MLEYTQIYISYYAICFNFICLTTQVACHDRVTTFRRRFRGTPGVTNPLAR
jgi:hypothetical protein